MNIQRIWLFFENYTLILLTAIFFIYPPATDLNLFSNISLTVIIIYLYMQMNIFAKISELNEKKRNLGERWLNIGLKGKVSDKIKIQTPIALTLYGFAFYMYFKYQEPILMQVFFVVVIKDFLVSFYFYKIIFKVLKKEVL